MDTIDSHEALRALYPEPVDLVIRKALTALDPHSLAFLRLSPFLLIATQGAGGSDVSPRGDPPGFVKVIDDRTLLIPERPGNNRVDTLGNIIDNPRTGLIFLVPGLGEALRLNGLASVVVGPELADLAHQDRVPKAAILFRIEEVFFHCAKAIIRSRLWSADIQVDKSSFPPLGKILADQIAGYDAEALIEKIRRGDRETLY